MSAIQTGVYRLGRDAETRYLPSGEAVCNLSLAYNWGKKDAQGKQQTTWIEAGLWGKRAESVAQYLTKGTAIFVVLSDLHVEHFNKADGTPGVKLAARVDNFDFINMPRSEGEQQRPAPASRPVQPARPPTSKALDDDDDEIPF